MTKKAVEDNIENLALTVQKYLSGNPAILVGSGCSVPYGLPTMDSLADAIIAQLSSKFKAEESWMEFVKQLSLKKNLEIALEAVAMEDDIHDEIIKIVWDCINGCDNTAFLSFLRSGNYPDINRIIRKCVQTGTKTNIITTNYDRLIEYAIDDAGGKCISGFSGNYIKKFVKFDSNVPKRAVNLYKVHGSIDWFKNMDGGSLLEVNFADISSYREHFSPMIVTPGNRKYKETHNDPFRTVIAEADKAIRESSAFLCIGYGFNDEHIQPIIIEENRSSRKPVVIVTKDITQKMKELFHTNAEFPCIIITENSENGGSKVFFNKDEYKIFDQPYWELKEFTKLWVG